MLVCMSENVADNRFRELWDRLVLLLIAQPREGWELEFEAITRARSSVLRFLVQRGRAMSNPQITYTPHREVSPESELDVLANIYAYLIRTHDSKRTAEPAQPCAGDTTSSTRRKEAGMT